MKNYQEDWFQDKLDMINEIENQAMESEEFLDATKQLDEIKSAVLALIPEENREKAEELFDSVPEFIYQAYNAVMKPVVCTTKFEL